MSPSGQFRERDPHWGHFCLKKFCCVCYLKPVSRITLDEFILEMMHTRQTKLSVLIDLFTRLDLRDSLIEEHVHFCNESYARNLLCRTPRFDMLVICWKPGQHTTIHDHAGSMNVTRVYRGTLTSRIFEVYERPAPGRALIRQNLEENIGKDALSTLDVEGIHQMANTSSEDLVTVHVYSPPLKDITVYSLKSSNVDRVTLRYTLEDEFAY